MTYRSGIVLLLTLFLFACGGGGASTQTPPTPNTPAPSNPGNGGTPDTLYPDYNTTPQPADMTGMEKDAQQIAADIRLGWNIGNTMEATGGETAWGNPEVSAALIKLVKDSGFNAIRIPLAWDQYADQDNAKIDDAWLDRVHDVVQMCIDENLYVLVNIHWDGGWLENNVTTEQQDNVNAKQRAFWQQIATKLRDFDQKLLFASANEPAVEDAEQMEVLLTYHQTFVDAVRETGGKNAYRTLVVQGPTTDIEKTNDLWTHMPVDTITNRLMAEVHFYTPYQFTLMREDESWGAQFYFWGESYHSDTQPERNATFGDETLLEEQFALMKVQFVDMGIPVILGEFSAMRRTNLTGDDLQRHLDSRAYYHQYAVEAALRNGLLPFYWDNGSLDDLNSGIFDRHQNTVFDQQTLDALLAGEQAAP